MRHPEHDKTNEYLEKIIPSLGQFETDSRQASEQLGLGGISLSRGEANVLRWVVASKPLKKAVEIGTLTGLSGLYILDGLQTGGQLWTLEKTEEHAKHARPILEDFAQKNGKSVKLVVGDARETLDQVAQEGPFDFIFIDGNKAAYGDYLAWAERNLQKGGLLVADNVFLGGSVVTGPTPESRFSSKQIEVLLKFNQRLMDKSVWRGALLPTGEGLFLAERV